MIWPSILYCADATIVGLFNHKTIQPIRWRNRKAAGGAVAPGCMAKKGTRYSLKILKHKNHPQE